MDILQALIREVISTCPKGVIFRNSSCKLQIYATDDFSEKLVYMHVMQRCMSEIIFYFKLLVVANLCNLRYFAKIATIRYLHYREQPYFLIRFKLKN